MGGWIARSGNEKVERETLNVQRQTVLPCKKDWYQVFSMMRLQRIILLPLFVLCACETNEPEATRSTPWPAPPGMLTFGSASANESIVDLALGKSDEILAMYDEWATASANAFCLKLDAQGKSLWPVRRLGQGINSTQRISPCPDGNALLLTSYFEFALRLLTPSGAELWLKDLWDLRPSFAMQLGDGRIALFTGRGGVARLFLYDHDADTMQTAYASDSAAGGASATCLLDAGDGMVILGGTLYTASDQRAGYAYLLRFDAATSRVLHFPMSRTPSRRMLCASSVSNGEFAVVLRELSDVGTVPSQLLLQRWSVTGTLIAEQVCTGMDVNAIAVSPDGGYVLSARRQVDLSPEGARIVKRSSNGDIQWEWSLSRRSQQGPHGVVFDYIVASTNVVVQQDGKIVCGGSASAFGSGMRDAWLLRLTADGRVDSTFGR
jgi:hypothetical protein